MKFAWNFHNECCSIRKLFSNFVLSQTDRHTESVFHSVLTKKSDSFNVNRGNERHSFSCLDRFGQNNFAPQFSYLFKCGVKHSFIRFRVLSEPLCRWTKTAPHFLFVQPTTCNTRLVELRGGGEFAEYQPDTHLEWNGISKNCPMEQLCIRSCPSSETRHVSERIRSGSVRLRMIRIHTYRRTWSKIRPWNSESFFCYAHRSGAGTSGGRA